VAIPGGYYYEQRRWERPHPDTGVAAGTGTAAAAPESSAADVERELVGLGWDDVCEGSEPGIFTTSPALMALFGDALLFFFSFSCDVTFSAGQRDMAREYACIKEPEGR
jgi:hypothetical protein